jgi:hypothetical protein
VFEPIILPCHERDQTSGDQTSDDQRMTCPRDPGIAGSNQATRTEPSKWTVTSLPKREELLLRAVFALPNACAARDADPAQPSTQVAWFWAPGLLGSWAVGVLGSWDPIGRRLLSGCVQGFGAYEGRPRV